MKNIKRLFAVLAVGLIISGCGVDEVVKGTLDSMVESLTSGMDKKYTTLSPFKIDIPDNGVVRMKVNADTTTDVKNVAVAIYASHERIGDLKLTLVSPLGTSVVLMENIGGNNELKEAIGFRDNASNSLSDYPSATTTYKPQENLSAFTGENPNGDWELIVEDTQNGKVGKTTGFSIWLDLD